MKTIGFIDYYISEWHANNYPTWIKEVCEKEGLDFKVEYAWAELDVSPLDNRSTEEWCKEFGVQKCSSIKEVCEKADYILILAPSDPEKHLAYAEEALKYGKNTYIDKTFAPDFNTAEKIFELGKKYNTKFFSSSALRYATELDDMVDTKSVVTLGGGGNMPEYIIHQIEMAVKLLNDTAKRLRVEKVGDNQYVTFVEFDNDKKATFNYSVANPFAVSCQAMDKRSRFSVIRSDFFKILIADILKFYQTSKPSFNTEQTLEVMKIREAVIVGMEKNGQWITL